MPLHLPRTALRPLSITVLTLVIAACGGGGGGGDEAGGGEGEPGSSATPPPAAGSAHDRGAVSAAFSAGTGATPGYFLNGVGSQVLGQLNTFTQSASGAMTALNDRQLSGSTTATEDISGDAFHAQGRWTLGTVTSPSGAEVLRGNNAAYHYLAYRRVAAFPTGGSFTCDAGRFTAPTYVGGAVVHSDAHTGTASGSATLSFDAAGAKVTGQYSVRAGSGADDGEITATVTGPTHTGIGGGYLGGNAGSVTAIGDGGNGSFLVAVAYKAALSSGANYQGVASFRCR